jgi:hypothetical protein
MIAYNWKLKQEDHNVSGIKKIKDQNEIVGAKIEKLALTGKATIYAGTQSISGTNLTGGPQLYKCSCCGATEM